MAGQRGLLAFWMGGAGAAQANNQGAVVGMLAPWLGGAGAAAAPATTSGVHSLLAPWLGGAGAAVGAPPPPPPPPPMPHPGGGVGVRVRVPPAMLSDLQRQLIDEDELLVILAAQIAGAGLLH